ncbi:MAG: hypothetical protein AB1634_15475 [Thermodesulfobacteriota bacterium]
MENACYAVNLAIHILAAILCVAAPFYQLRWVHLRGKLGTALIYPFDRVIENVLTFQVKLCFALILVLIATGFAFPLIHYAFHGQWRQTGDLALGIFAAKAVLAFIGLAINGHGVLVLDPEIQKTFATFLPAVQPSDELLNRFWAMRGLRKKLCGFCFCLAILIVLITPILRFAK